MAQHIHIYLNDNAWEESKHPRKDDGKFGSGSAPDPRREKRMAEARAQNLADKDGEKAALEALKKHPMYAKEDMEYFLGKGYTAAEIKGFWDRDHKAGHGPNHFNKNSKENQAELGLIRAVLTGKAK